MSDRFGEVAMVACIDRVDGVLFDDHDWVYRNRPEVMPVRKPTDVMRLRYCEHCNLHEVLERAGEVAA